MAYGLMNAVVLECCFGFCAWLVYLEWGRLSQPVLAFAQHVGAAALSAL